MYTRQDYLSGRCSHRQYYAQFVDVHTKQHIFSHIGKHAIMQSKNEHFNDIPLGSWDTTTLQWNGQALKEAGEEMTMATKVCILKEAARQILEEESK